jgi:cell wall-associated NlpC family hydrolase
VYKEHGWPISHGTVNQKTYPAVPREQIQPGDLMLFSDINVQGRGARITHVGLYAGDLDGDGTGDMIHAANYPDGVVKTKNVFGNPYYRTRLVVITRPPRGGGL